MPDQPHRTICLTLGVRAVAFPHSTSDRRKWLPAFWQCLTAPSLLCNSAAGNPAMPWTWIPATGTGTVWDETQFQSYGISCSHGTCTSCRAGEGGCWVIALGVPMLSVLIFCALYFQIRITALVTDISKMCFAPAGFSWVWRTAGKCSWLASSDYAAWTQSTIL